MVHRFSISSVGHLSVQRSTLAFRGDHLAVIDPTLDGYGGLEQTRVLVEAEL